MADLIYQAIFGQHIRDLMEQWHIPGFSIAIVKDGEVGSAVFGYASLESETPITTDTIFDCASMSKSLTAASVAWLVDSKEYEDLSLETPISKILPDEFVMSDDYATAKITLEDILSHRTGLPSHDYSCYGIDADCPDDARTITFNLRHLAMNAAPRTKYQYNNIMFTVASYVVEKLSGEKFAEFLQTRFFNALGMRSTYLQPSAVVAAGQSHNFSTPYEWRHGRYTEVKHLEQPEGQGAGSLHSRPVDYIKWVQAMIDHSGPPLSKDMYADLVKPRIFSSTEVDKVRPFSSFTGCALGWEVEYYRGYQIVHHGGLVPGYGSHMCFLPNLKLGMVMMGNSTLAGHLGHTLSMEIIDECLRIPHEQRINWVLTASENEEELRGDDDDGTEYREIRQMILEGRRNADEEETKAEHEWKLSPQSYIGTFHNDGYHDITVSVREDNNVPGTLYIDGKDRSMMRDIILEHVCDDRMFIANIADEGGFANYAKAEFRIGADQTVEAIGMALVDEMEDYLVWFERVRDA